MRKLIELENSKVNNNGYADCRHILVDDEWPENYSDETLLQAVDNIYIEWEKIRGEAFYSNFIDKKVSKDYDELRIRALEFIERCYKWGMNDLATDTISVFKFKGIKDKSDVVSKKEQIIQKLQIEADEEENKSHGIIIFEDILTPIEEMLKINLDYNITVAKYESWSKKYKKRING